MTELGEFLVEYVQEPRVWWLLDPSSQHDLFAQAVRLIVELRLREKIAGGAKLRGCPDCPVGGVLPY